MPREERKLRRDVRNLILQANKKFRIVLDREEIKDKEEDKEEDLFTDVKIGSREGTSNSNASRDAKTVSKDESSINSKISIKAKTSNGETIIYYEGDINS